jgi:hypothetical protein
MTLNKSLISVAAATILAAGFAGCGSSSSSSSTTTQPTALTAVDGYTIGGTVTVGYDVNGTQYTVAVDNTANYAQVSNAAGVAVAGKPSFSLADLNSTVLDNLVYVKLGSHAGYTTTSGITYAPTYTSISDSNFTYIAGTDLDAATTFEMIAPSGYKYPTPITTLIYYAAKADVDANESNRTALYAKAATSIAAALGVSADDIKNVDPMTTLTSPTKKNMGFVNTMMGDFIKNTSAANLALAGTSLTNATAATGTTIAAKIASAMGNLATAATAAGLTASATGYTATKNAYTADPSLADSISSMSLDVTRNATTTSGTFTPELKAVVAKDFNVTTVQINDVNVSDLLSSGAKITTDNLLVKFGISSNSGADNNFTKNLRVVAKFSGERTAVAADVNATQITFSLPFTIGSTGGDVNATLPASTNIAIEGKDNTGAVFNSELNASYIDNSFIACTAGSNIVQVNVKNILAALDTNLSTFNIGTDQVALTEIVLVDTDSSLGRVNSAQTASVIWSSATTTSMAGHVTGTGYSVLKQATADYRTAATRANVGAYATNPNSTNSVAVTGTINGVTADATNNKVYIINAGSTSVYDFNATNLNDETFEDNTTLTLTARATSIDNNTTDTVVDVNTTAVALARANAGTVATNLASVFKLSATPTAATNRHAMVTYKVTSTDEFGLAYEGTDKDRNITFAYNRAPSDLNISALVFSDANNTAKDKNSSWFTITDLDGTADQNASSDVNVTAVASGAVNNAAGTFASDYNLTAQNGVLTIDLNGTAGSSAEINVSFEANATGYIAMNVESNDSNWTVASGKVLDINFTLTTGAKDMFGAYGATGTLAVDLNGSL